MSSEIVEASSIDQQQLLPPPLELDPNAVLDQVAEAAEQAEKAEKAAKKKRGGAKKGGGVKKSAKKSGSGKSDEAKKPVRPRLTGELKDIVKVRLQEAFEKGKRAGVREYMASRKSSLREARAARRRAAGLPEEEQHIKLKEGEVMCFKYHQAVPFNVYYIRRVTRPDGTPTSGAFGFGKCPIKSCAARVCLAMRVPPELEEAPLTQATPV